MNGLIRFGLGLANVPDGLVADIDKALPGAARLIAEAKKMEPDLRALEPIVERLLKTAGPDIQLAIPIVERLLPQLKAAWPDVQQLLPVAEKIVAFVGDKK